MNLAKLSKARFIKFGVFPAFVYFACFCILSFPAILELPSRFFGDEVDGMQNVWNIWHVRQSIVNLQNPYFSSMIHFPEGTSLLAHTLSLVNSIPGVFLESFFSPFTSYNILVVISVVASGLSAFLLAYYFCENYWPSILAGFIYAFSGYSVLHLGSHINLTSLEWLPLFLLFWHKMLIRPRITTASIAALFLILTFYSELYYAFYAALLAFIFLIAVMIKKKPEYFATIRHLVSFGIFLTISVAAISPFLLALSRAFKAGGFVDLHIPEVFSTELISFIIPGPLNDWFSQQLHFGEGLGQSFIGISVWGLIIFAIINRKKLPAKDFFTAWLFILFFFLLLSLGPILHIVNYEISLPLPYSLLQSVLPIANIGGMPNRMMAVVILAASMISAMSLARIWDSQIKKKRLVVGATILLVVFEYMPAQPLRPIIPEQPAYAYAIKNMPPGAVFDDTTDKLLNYQLIHGHPIFGGYISRRPGSVAWQDEGIEKAFQAGNYDALCSYGFRYVVIAGNGKINNAELRYYDSDKKVYDLSHYDSYCDEHLASTDTTNSN
ncbi:MAG: YfhO family protein [Actinobacteria bacterium]|nr:YfhO family protein [Actinomycetota bacterium]MCL5882652.1 YfhO family protein [Actinomycetota bacterium]